MPTEREEESQFIDVSVVALSSVVSDAAVRLEAGVIEEMDGSRHEDRGIRTQSCFIDQTESIVSWSSSSH